MIAQTVLNAKVEVSNDEGFMWGTHKEVSVGFFPVTILTFDENYEYGLVEGALSCVDGPIELRLSSSHIFPITSITWEDLPELRGKTFGFIIRDKSECWI